jgi:hypothetical protein
MPATASKSVRISEAAHATLSQIAEEEDISLREEIDRVAEKERRRRMFAQAESAYAEMKRGSGEAWNELKSEYDLWEQTSADGLADDE